MMKVCRQRSDVSTLSGKQTAHLLVCRWFESRLVPLLFLEFISELQSEFELLPPGELRGVHGPCEAFKDSEVGCKCTSSGAQLNFWSLLTTFQDFNIRISNGSKKSVSAETSGNLLICFRRRNQNSLLLFLFLLSGTMRP